MPGDTLTIAWTLSALSPRCAVPVTLRRAARGEVVHGTATALLETGREVDLVRAGGIIPMILDRALGTSGAAASSGVG